MEVTRNAIGYTVRMYTIQGNNAIRRRQAKRSAKRYAPLRHCNRCAFSARLRQRSFWEDNRLVSNRRLHEELGVTLAYPNYRAGLEAILSSESR